MTTESGSESSSVNENTSAAAEPVVAPGGNGVTSFDELEALHSAPPAKQTKVLTKGEKKSAVPKTDGKGELENAEQEKDGEKTDQDQEEVKADESKETKESKDSKEKGKDEKTDEGKPKVKVHKVRLGDKDVEIPGDTPLEVTVNGKTEKISLQEVLNNYSGKTDWTRKYSDLDKERKSFQTERHDLQSSIDKLYDLAIQKNKPEEAIAFLAEAMGGDGQVVLKNLRDTFWSQFDQLKDLSQEQRETFEKDQKLKYLESRESARKTDEETKRINSALQNRIKTVQEAHNLTEDGFIKAYEELKASGEVPEKDLSPEKVGEFYERKKTLTDLDKLVLDINPELDNRPAIVKELHAIMKQHGYGLEDIRDIAVEVYGSKKAKGLVKKLKQARPSDTARPSASRIENPVSFDEIL